MENFRTAMFGGFNRDDVIKYIEKLKNEFYDYKKNAEAKISELEQKINALEASAETDSDALLDELAESIFTDESISKQVNVTDSQISDATNELKKTADNICDCLNEFMDKISENSIAVTVEIPQESNTEYDSNDGSISSILSSVLPFSEKEITEAEKSDAPQSVFAQIISAAIDGKSEITDSKDVPESSEEDVKPKSLLDELLPSALFTV